METDIAVSATGWRFPPRFSIRAGVRVSVDSPPLVARALDLWISTVRTLPGKGRREVRRCPRPSCPACGAQCGSRSPARQSR